MLIFLAEGLSEASSDVSAPSFEDESALHPARGNMNNAEKKARQVKIDLSYIIYLGYFNGIYEKSRIMV
jgi:hypothetical protein